MEMAEASILLSTIDHSLYVATGNQPSSWPAEEPVIQSSLKVSGASPALKGQSRRRLIESLNSDVGRGVS